MIDLAKAKIRRPELLTVFEALTAGEGGGRYGGCCLDLGQTVATEARTMEADRAHKAAQMQAEERRIELDEQRFKLEKEDWEIARAERATKLKHEEEMRRFELYEKYRASGCEEDFEADIIHFHDRNE